MENNINTTVQTTEENYSVNILNLKRKEIREVITLKNDLLHPIIVYTATPEQRKKILMLLTENLEETPTGITSNLNDFSQTQLLLNMLTNIKLKLDLENDKKIIDEILEDPSDELRKTIRIINEIVMDIFTEYYDNIMEMAKMPEPLRVAYIDKITKDVELAKAEEEKVVELSEKEKKKLELLKQLESLESEEE